MLTRYSKNNYINIYINAAYELGYDVNILDQKNDLIEIKSSRRSLFFLNCTSHLNTAIGHKIAKNKVKTKEILNDVVDIIPNYREFQLYPSFSSAWKKEIKNIHEYVKSYNHNIVIKPINLLMSKNVTVKPQTKLEVDDAINAIKKRGATKLMVEEFIEGREYRIIVVNGEIVDVLERIPAYVTGNGHKTITQLVEEKNNARKNIHLPIIKLDNDSKKLLKSVGYEAKNIPKDKTHLKLKSNCNLNSGGETKRVSTDKIHEKYHKICKDIGRHTFLKYFGVDLITPNIIDDPYSNRSGINEINASPGSKASYYADLMEKSPLKGVKNILVKLMNIT